MIRHSASVCIDADASEVWERLARLEDIQLWSEAVLAAECNGERSRGVGAERTCRLSGGVTIHERWLEWEEGRSFRYEGHGIPFVANAASQWTVHPHGHQTLLTSESEVRLKGGAISRPFSPLLSRQLDRVAKRTLTAFKYLVEHGEPPPGRHSRLPAAPAAC